MSSHDELARGEQYLALLQHEPTRVLLALTMERTDVFQHTGPRSKPAYPFVDTLKQLIGRAIAGHDVDVRKLGALLRFHDQNSRWTDEVAVAELSEMLGETNVENLRRPARQRVDHLVSPEPVMTALTLNDPLTLLRELGQGPVELDSDTVERALAMPHDGDWGSPQQLTMAALAFEALSQDDAWANFDVLVEVMPRLHPVWRTQPFGNPANHELIIGVLAVAFGRKKREDVKFPAR